ncbi:MAG TPA: DUF1016 N-terminal domain-containing protein [Gammaproteobacteria bacterium]|nr:DUF1016 N-terminal domain-containing protein [Gammaproteobacteria bacterium]
MLKKIAGQLHLDTQYQNLLSEIKSRFKKAQLRAAIVVNHELIQFYWEIGELILDQQQKSSWGDKIFNDLAVDLQESFPGVQGFSKSNLYYMRMFAKHYPTRELFQALPGKLTWTHHTILIQMIEPQDAHIKQWYAAKTVENG